LLTFGDNTGSFPLSRFGRKGLSNLGENQAYIKLCSNGFDAVVTIALVNHTKETEHQHAASYSFRNKVFYHALSIKSR
jgi:hypothetical protein